jgi:hypothetical protein
LDKAAVLAALKVIYDACEDEEFREWIEENEETLDYEYDQYRFSCAQDGEDADGFITYALRRYVTE